MHRGDNSCWTKRRVRAGYKKSETEWRTNGSLKIVKTCGEVTQTTHHKRTVDKPWPKRFSQINRGNVIWSGWKSVGEKMMGQCMIWIKSSREKKAWRITDSMPVQAFAANSFVVKYYKTCRPCVVAEGSLIGKVIVENPIGRRSLRRLRQRWFDQVKRDLSENK